MNLSDLPPGTPSLQFPGGCISRTKDGAVYETRNGVTVRLYPAGAVPNSSRQYTHGMAGDGEIVTTPDDRVRADWGAE